MSDDLGDRMKGYEARATARTAFKGEPIILRLDGKNFHSFTHGLNRPYDSRLSKCMIDTTIALVEFTNANVGYTQSDEITLVILSESHGQAELPFGGRFQKLESLTAAFCSVFFNRAIARDIPEKADKLAIFDSRGFTVPNVTEAYNCVLWRQQDATKNAISMAAQSMFSHKELQHKTGSEMQEMMHTKGVNFNDYPAFFKRGTYVKRTKKLVPLDHETIAQIPEKYRPTRPIERSVIVSLDIWLTKQEDPVKALFGDAYGTANSG